MILNTYIKLVNERRARKRQAEESRHGYIDGLEISKASARVLPNNCAVIERTADGVNVGTCQFYLKDGVCPRHGKVKA